MEWAGELCVRLRAALDYIDALERLLEHLGIPLDEALVCGPDAGADTKREFEEAVNGPD